MQKRLIALSKEQIQQLYASCGLDQAGRHDFTLLTLLFNGGMTIDELADLRVTYLDFSKRWIWAARGLERPRFVPMNSKAAKALTDWLENFPQPHFVFGNWNNSQATFYRFRSQTRKSAISGRIEEIGRGCGIDLSAELGKVTLTRRLLEVSEEGQEILSFIPEDKWDMINLPVENLPPFSVVSVNSDMPMASKGFIPVPTEFGKPPAEDDIIRTGRAMLEKAAASL